MSRASLRMWGATDVSVRTMAVFAPLASVVAIVGAALGGGVGAAWALAAGSTVGAVVWAWRSERAATQRSAADRSAVPAGEVLVTEVRA
jgi:membrane associated rhomboid family serine protease